MTGILLVTHNSAAHIASSLEAVERWRGSEDRVLVVDNHSSDATCEVVRKSNTALIANAKNLGFAGAVNQGFREFGSAVKRVLLLNPDVILRTPIAPLVDVCDRYGLATGRLVDSVAGITQTGFSVRRFPTPAALLFETLGINRIYPQNGVNRSYRHFDFDYTRAGLVEQPAGALLMIRRDVWVDARGFDEDFFPVWFEDVDFCLRAARLGFQTGYLPSVEGLHAGGHSVNLVPEPQRRVYWYASLLRYSRKHYRGFGRQLVSGGVLVAGVARSTSGMLQPSKTAARISWMKVAKLGLDSFMLGRTRVDDTIGSPAVESLSPGQGLTADAVNVRSNGGAVNSSEINNTERALKRLHAR